MPNLIAPTRKYSNPVFAGDHPDPSIIRVGERDFWATTTSTDWAPHFPLLHSTDLIHWEVVTAVFDRRPTWSAGNYWAPELSEYRGRYYLYYTGKRADGPLSIGVATADAPQGPYTDHGPLVGEWCGSIDPMATEDENGVRYLLWKEDGNSVGTPTRLWAQRLSEDGTVLLDEPVELLRNDAPWEGTLIEAPFVVRRDGWFYMFYSGNACCGIACKYAVGVARSRSLLGPWVKYEHNPILATNEHFRCPGHGSVVDDAQGRMFYLYHAYAAGEEGLAIGRQVLLDEITWDAIDGWPAINHGRGPSVTAAAPFGTRLRPREAQISDDFTALDLDPRWQWPHHGRPAYAIERRNGGHLHLSPPPDAYAHDPIAAVLARPILEADYIATAVLDAASVRVGEAGLAAYGDHANALGVGVRDGEVVLWERRAGVHRELTALPGPTEGAIVLRMMVAAGRRYRFAFSRDGERWEELGGELDGRSLPPWDRAVRVALTAGGDAGVRARFDALRVAPYVPNVRFLVPDEPAVAEAAADRPVLRLVEGSNA